MLGVSVIVLTYNRVDWVLRAVASVLAQSWQNLELLVIDDGSGDDTLARLAVFEDPRLRVVALEHSGHIAQLRQRGQDLAQHPCISFLDSDDWWEPTHLEGLMALLARHGDAAFAFANVCIEASDGRLIKPRCYDETESYCRPLFADLIAGELAIYSSSACCFRRGKDQCFDQALFVGDHDFLVKHALSGWGAFNPSVSVHITRHDDQLSDRMSWRTYEEMRHSLRWCRTQGHLSRWQAYLIGAEAAYRQGLGLHSEGQRRAAMGCYMYALLHPKRAPKALARLLMTALGF